MKLVVLVISFLSVVFADHPVRQEIVDEVRAKTDLWEPEEVDNNIFKYHSEEQLIAMCGAHMNFEKERELAAELGLMGLDDEGNSHLPTNFDAREKWPD